MASNKLILQHGYHSVQVILCHVKSAQVWAHVITSAFSTPN